MRYELTDYEWDAIKPMLPNKARDCRNSIHFLGLNVGWRCRVPESPALPATLWNAEPNGSSASCPGSTVGSRPPQLTTSVLERKIRWQV
jgi:hypothetical protein